MVNGRGMRVQHTCPVSHPLPITFLPPVFTFDTIHILVHSSDFLSKVG